MHLVAMSIRNIVLIRLDTENGILPSSCNARCMFLNQVKFIAGPRLVSYIAVSSLLKHGPGSSVRIATDYGLDCPVIESRWGEIFRPSRPALRSTQPPVQWVPGLSRE